MQKLKTFFGLPNLHGAAGFLVALLIDALSSGLFVPLSLLYFQVVVGLPLLTIGLILTIATALTIPITLLTGVLVDRVGAQRITACSQFLQAGGFLGYLFVHNIFVLFAMALLTTAGARMFYAAHTALIVNIAAPDERDRWYAVVGAIRNIGASAGSLLAGIALATGHALGYQVILGACAVILLIAAYLLLRLRLRESSYIYKQELVCMSYSTVLMDRPFVSFVVSNIPFPLCALMFGTALPVYATEAVHAPPWIIGPVLAFNTILVIVCQTIVIKRVESYRRTRVLAVAGFIWFVTYGLLALALIVPRLFLVPYLFMLVVPQTLAGLLYIPTACSLVAEAGPSAVRGRYLATYELSWGIAAALVPGLFTLLYAIAPVSPWMVLAGLVFLASIVTLLLEPWLPTQAVRNQSDNT